MEIKYRNSVEKSVEPIMNALVKTYNFSRMVNNRRWIIAFIGCVTLMFVADVYLRGKSPAMLVSLIIVAAAFLAVLVGYRKLYTDSCRKRIIRTLTDTDSLSSERLFSVDDKEIRIGTEKYASKYSLDKLDFCYEDSDHLVIGLKNGAVAAIGKEFFDSQQQYQQVYTTLIEQVKKNEKE